jgi:hypothetical protein
MVGLIITVMLIWMVYEMWRAPYMDDKGNAVKPVKTIKDLFKKQK